MSSRALALKAIAACWTLFAVLWIVAAVKTKTTIYRESRLRRWRYGSLLLVAYLVTVYAPKIPFPVNARFLRPDAALTWAAAAVCLTGFAFALWARVTLGGNWSGSVTLKEKHELVERGPYRLVRHPIYTGLILMFLATVVALGYVGGAVGFCLVIVGFWIKLIDEEALMLSQFGDRYAAYQRRVKRLIPFVL